MGWELRKGRQYYYEKKLTERGPVSIYRGSANNPTAIQLALVANNKRVLKKKEKEHFELAKQMQQQMLDESNTLETLIFSALTRMLDKHHHFHRGSWRQRRRQNHDKQRP